MNVASLAGTSSASPRRDKPRIDWVDYAKGWSIVLVVTLHSALGVGLAVGGSGWLHDVVLFAKPFRMPDFFLVAGLFAGPVIVKPWREFLDKRVVHFAYFYALWLFISLLTKAVALGLVTPKAFVSAYLFAMVEPFSSLWFIQLLPFLFIAVRLARSWPTWLVLGLAVAAHVVAAAYPEGGDYVMASALTGWTTIDSFLLFFVYFFIGSRFSDAVFAFARFVGERVGLAMGGLAFWAAVQGVAVALGWPQIPGVTLLFGLTGAFAVIAVSALLARAGSARWLAVCGRNSLVIYLSFFVPMAITRTLLVKTGVVTDVGTLSLIVTAVAVAAPLAMNAIVRGTALGFLYKRPAWARLSYAATAKGIGTSVPEAV